MKMSSASLEQTLGHVGEPLVDSLAQLQVRLEPVLDESAVRATIRATWESLVDDIARGVANLSGEYLAELHRQLATLAGGDTPGTFMEGGWEGQLVSWAALVEELSEEYPLEPAWVLAQLCWGEQVQSVSLTLGWLAMNVALVTNEGVAIVPPVADHERLLRSLKDAGPNLYDAESLRALIGTYTAEQWPSATD